MRKTAKHGTREAAGARRKPDPRGRRRLAGAALLACAVCALCSGALSGDNGAEGVEDTRTMIENWVKTRRIISKEERDWALGKEMLNERIELVQREIDSLREKIAEAEESITEADKKRAGMVEEHERLKRSSDTLAAAVFTLETRTKELLERLPESVRRDVQQLSQQIPDDPAETKLSLGIRFQNVMGVLNHLNKRNRDITFTSEKRELPDGTSAEVTALYIGISHAYYVGANEKVAGVGRPSPDGWVWTPANEAAPQIAEAIAILKNEQVASFVKLPIEIQ